MIKHTIEEIKWLLNSDLTSYAISKYAGLSPQFVDRYKRNPNEVPKMKLENANFLEDCSLNLQSEFLEVSEDMERIAMLYYNTETQVLDIKKILFTFYSYLNNDKIRGDDLTDPKEITAFRTTMKWFFEQNGLKKFNNDFCSELELMKLLERKLRNK